MYVFCTRVRCAEGKPVRLPRRRDSVRLGRLRPRSHCAGPQSAERLAQDLTTCFAWSPKRSARLDTPLRFWLSCLLALPTVLATDLVARRGSFGWPIVRGSGTPRTFLRRVLLFSAIPAATPAAAAPAATAGPLALLAAFLTVSNMPLRLGLFARLRFALLRREREEPLLDREALRRAPVDADDDFGGAEVPEDREEPLRDRDALRRAPVVAEDDFGRAEVREELEEPLRDAPLALRADPLALVFEPELLDELLLLCPLREADLAVEPVRADGCPLLVARVFARGRAAPFSRLPPEGVFRLPSAYSITVLRPLCRRSYSRTRPTASPSRSRSAAFTSSTSMSS